MTQLLGQEVDTISVDYLLVGDIVDKVNAVVNAYLKSGEGREQLRKLGITPLGGTTEELKTHLERETAKWGPIIKGANITLQ